MTIRKAKKGDIDQVANLTLEMYKFHGKLSERHKIKSDAECLKFIKNELKENFKKQKRTILVCEEKRKIPGYVEFEIQKWPYLAKQKEAWIYAICVDKNYRGEGIASALTKEVAKRLKKLGIKEINISYVPENKKSSGFWKKLKAKTIAVNAVISIKDIL
ncbi:MAG: GNAT family N-acetyltransferase [Nanoarchaeota archaeon]|nr:GNAT family N-acetyltransferase [Nanoarchaeota archaeon]